LYGGLKNICSSQNRHLARDLYSILEPVKSGPIKIECCFRLAVLTNNHELMVFPNMKLLRYLLMIICLLALYDCSFFRTPKWDILTTTQVSKTLETSNSISIESADNTEVDHSLEQLLLQGEKLWSERSDPIKLKTFIETYQAILEKKNTYEHLSRLSYACFLYGHSLSKQEALGFFLLGAEYGELALAHNNKFLSSIQKGKELEYAIGQLDSSTIDAIYWTAMNLFFWAEGKGDLYLLKQRRRIETLMQRVEDLDEKFFFYGVERFRGIYKARISQSSFGKPGDLNKAQIHFTQCLRKYPDSLETKVAFAKWYAKDPRITDCKLYKSLLLSVINALEDTDSENRAEQTITQTEAKKLIKLTCSM